MSVCPPGHRPDRPNRPKFRPPRVPPRVGPAVDISEVRTRLYSSVRRLGEYELLRKIGSGGMAEVWMGRRAAMAGASKAVAIKLLAREVVDDPTYRDMFLEEARLSMLLTNSNVVQVFDCGEIGGECFMVMEWVDGLNLAELTQKMQQGGEGLSVAVAAHVIGEVLRALAYAHGLHHDGVQTTIVHRDVSPHNVLVSISGEVKLADFGVARLAREETSGLHVKGKLRYMAPEQLRGRSRDPTVDLYAVGAILHELLEGKRFRSTRDEADLYAQVLSGEVAPLTVSVPPELEQLRSRLLEVDPKARIQTADEALELLCAWPGYRNGSVELGKLTRRWIGVGAPRSGIVSTSMAQADPRTTPIPAMMSPAVTPAKPMAMHAPSGPSAAVTLVDAVAPAERERESGPQAERSITETRTAVSGAHVAPTSVVATVPAGSSRGSLWIGVSLTLALSFGVFGLGFPLGWWGGAGEQPVVQRETPPAAEVADEKKPPEVVAPEVVPDVVPTSTGPVAPEPSAATGDETASHVAIASESGDETGDRTGDGDGAGDDAKKKTPKKPPPKKAETPAEVQFNAGDYTFVYVKIDGKELTLEPRGNLSLAPGSYTVQFRKDEAEPWKAASPRIKIESGKSYKVRMQAPAGLKLEQL